MIYPGIEQLGEKVLAYINWSYTANGECTHTELRNHFREFTVLKVCEWLAARDMVKFGTDNKLELIFIPIVKDI